MDAADERMSGAERDVVRKKEYDLAEMLAKVSPDSLHSEVDFGPSAGREEW